MEDINVGYVRKITNIKLPEVYILKTNIQIIIKKGKHFNMIINQIKFLQLVDRLNQIILILMLEILLTNNFELKLKLVDYHLFLRKKT